jgi:hypothetical protein
LNKVGESRLFVFVCSLFNYTFSVTQTINVEQKGDRWMMNWKGFGRKQSWPSIKVLSRHLLGGTGKNTKILSEDSRSLGWDLNTGPPKYEDTKKC